MKILFKLNEGGRKCVKVKDIKGMLCRIWFYVVEKKGFLFFVIIMVVISVIFGFFGLFVIGKVIDYFIVGWMIDGLVGVLFILFGIYFV